jgi:hypothetical protein
MLRFLSLALLLLPALAIAGDNPPQTTPEQATFIHEGDMAPTFTVGPAATAGHGDRAGCAC